MSTPNADLARLTSAIVGAYVENNTLSAGQLPELVQEVFGALSRLDQPAAPAEPEAPSLTPTQVRKSITREALISFEDGRPYKTLKRHLSSRGMTVADYKAKWGLPADYPTTAPAYSEARSSMAKTLGLGRKEEGESAPQRRKPRG
jgi:predicted transcriptional regulator